MSQPAIRAVRLCCGVCSEGAPSDVLGQPLRSFSNPVPEGCPRGRGGTRLSTGGRVVRNVSSRTQSGRPARARGPRPVQPCGHCRLRSRPAGERRRRHRPRRHRARWCASRHRQPRSHRRSARDRGLERAGRVGAGAHGQRPRRRSTSEPSWRTRASRTPSSTRTPATSAGSTTVTSSVQPADQCCQSLGHLTGAVDDDPPVADVPAVTERAMKDGVAPELVKARHVGDLVGHAGRENERAGLEPRHRRPVRRRTRPSVARTSTASTSRNSTAS